MIDPLELFPWFEPFLWGVLLAVVADSIGRWRTSALPAEPPQPLVMVWNWSTYG
jgi:hypothetical protein